MALENIIELAYTFNPEEAARIYRFTSSQLEVWIDYRMNYSNLTRGQFRKENQALYRRLRNHDLLEHVPLKLNAKKPEIDSKLDQGLTLRELGELCNQKISKQAVGLYLKRTKQHKKWLKLRGEKKRHEREKICQELVQTYQTKYPGYSRGQLQMADKKFYGKMENYSVIKYVPYTFKNCGKSDKQLINEYNRKYPGITRGRLQLLNNRLSEIMRYRGLLAFVPLRRKPKRKKIQSLTF